MELDVAWHEWYSVALAVVIDGMLAVSAIVWVLSPFTYLFVFLLCPFIYSVFLVSLCLPFRSFFLFICFCFVVCNLVLLSLFAYGITWVDVFDFHITWCMCYETMGYILVGIFILLFMYHHLCFYFL